MADVITIENIDKMRRKPYEWAKIYHIKLIKCDDFNALQNEYEWSWNLIHEYKYTLSPESDYEIATEYELRAEMLSMDMYLNASSKEKYLLDSNNKYIDTDFVRRRTDLL